MSGNRVLDPATGNTWIADNTPDLGRMLIQSPNFGTCCACTAPDSGDLPDTVIATISGTRCTTCATGSNPNFCQDHRYEDHGFGSYVLRNSFGNRRRYSTFNQGINIPAVLDVGCNDGGSTPYPFYIDVTFDQTCEIAFRALLDTGNLGYKWPFFTGEVVITYTNSQMAAWMAGNFAFEFDGAQGLDCADAPDPCPPVGGVLVPGDLLITVEHP